MIDIEIYQSEVYGCELLLFIISIIGIYREYTFLTPSGVLHGNYNRLSHSAKDTFKTCPTKYKFHYIDRLRSTEIFSPLIWGSAVDKGLEALIKQEDYKKAFLDAWTEQNVLGKPTQLKDNTLIKFLNSDYDGELLTQADYYDIEDQTGLKAEILLDVMEDILSKRRDNVNLDDQDKRLFNYVSWRCMKSKGIRILEAVKEEILPRITKIYSTQEKIELINDEGDAVVGYADLIAEIDNEPVPIILDFKTSGKRYKNDSVRTSAQLSLYAYALADKYNTRKGGYIVLGKKLKDVEVEKTCEVCGHDGIKRRHMTCDALIGGKRCGGTWKTRSERKVDIQLIIDDIPIETERATLEDFDSINKLIKNGTFEKNLEACKKFYGNMVVTCPYFGKCHEGSDEGLVKV